MIEQELVRQAAERKGIEVNAEEVDAAVAELRAVFDDDRRTSPVGCRPRASPRRATESTSRA